MAFGGGLDDEENVMSEINMTPLVDVMLVLLIIFIIAVPMLTHTVKLDLPRATSLPDEVVPPETITLSVAESGELHWNNEPISEEVFELRLQDIAAQEPQPELHIRGDRKVDYEHVVRVMSAVQQAGLLKLGFVTEPAD